MRSHMRAQHLRVSTYRYRTSIGIVQRSIEMEGVKVHPDTSSNLESEGPLFLLPRPRHAWINVTQSLPFPPAFQLVGTRRRSRR